MGRWFTRSIRPGDIAPNPNDPADVPPATVGPPAVTPGDPHGVVLDTSAPRIPPPPRVAGPMPWSGWPAEWSPGWGSPLQPLTDTAWTCLDLNASSLAAMPPYLVGASPNLDAEWMRNPNPDVYTSWAEFAKQLFWDFQLGEAFVLVTARYATGYPARFHVVPPWAVEVDFGPYGRTYKIGSVPVDPFDVLHVRYKSSVDDAHGHGPLEGGRNSLIAAEVLRRYATNLAAGGGIPPSVLEHPDELSAQQSSDLKAQWVEARLSAIGEPAVLTGGVKWTPVQVNPRDMGLVELRQLEESRIAVSLGVPPSLVGLPSGGDSMTYKNMSSMLDFHWRAGLRPKATAVMTALSEWALPRGTSVELNSDFYVQPEALERAQIAATLNGLVDPATGQQALTVEEIRDVERLDNITADNLVSGPVTQ